MECVIHGDRPVMGPCQLSRAILTSRWSKIQSPRRIESAPPRNNSPPREMLCKVPDFQIPSTPFNVTLVQNCQNRCSTVHRPVTSLQKHIIQPPWESAIVLFTQVVAAISNLDQSIIRSESARSAVIV